MPSLNSLTNKVGIHLTTIFDDKGFKEAEKNLDAIEKASKKLEVGWKSMAAVGAAATGVLVASAKAAIDYESAFAGIRKTVDATEEEFGQLSENIKNISREAPVSVTELSRIGELAGQLGVRGVDNLTKFIDTISKISVTTNLTAESASSDFARIANIMGEPIKNVDRMASAVVELGNNFATTESEIVAFASRIAGAGKIAGLTTADIFGIGAAMSSVGVEAEAGGTAVQKVLLAMSDAVVGSGKNLETFAEVSGLSVDAFKRQWEDEASVAFFEFVEGLGDAGDEAFAILDELEMTDQRLVRAFLSLANAGELLENAIGTSTIAFEENNALTEEARKRYETTASQLEILKNNLMLVAITLGETLLPIVNDFIEKMMPLLQNLADWIGKNPELTQTILGIAAAIGGVGVGGLVLVPAILNWIRLIQVLIPLIQGLVVLMAGPWGLAIAGIILAVTGLYVAWKENMFGIRDIVEKVVNFIIGKFNQAIELINAFIDLSNRTLGTSMGFFETFDPVSFTEGLDRGGGSPAGPQMSTQPNMSVLPPQMSVAPISVGNINIYDRTDYQSMLRDISYVANTR